MEKPKLYFYVFVRKDISINDQICQVAHACADAGRRFAIPVGAHLVLLQVPDEGALIGAAYLAYKSGIKCEVGFEPDDNMGRTAICTEAIPEEKREVFREYKLWRPSK